MEFYKTFALNYKSNRSEKRIFDYGMKVLKTISVFALAFLVLVSSSSFMVDVHLCKGKIWDMGLLSNAADCGMTRDLPPCHKQMLASCCDDETIVHEGEGFKASSSDITVAASTALDAVSPDVVLSEVVPSILFLQPDYYNYDPPLRSHDLTVSHSVFLI
jgi:hypothetical protein